MPSIYAIRRALTGKSTAPLIISCPTPCLSPLSQSESKSLQLLLQNLHFFCVLKPDVLRIGLDRTTCFLPVVGVLGQRIIFPIYLQLNGVLVLVEYYYIADLINTAFFDLSWLGSWAFLVCTWLSFLLTLYLLAPNVMSCGGSNPLNKIKQN